MHNDLHYHIVTGEPRSGTSLMMQTIERLGCSVWGESHPKNPDDPALKQARELLGIKPWYQNKGGYQAATQEERQKRIKALNEKFYEVAGLVVQGLRPNKALKMKQAIESNKEIHPDVKALRLYWVDKLLNDYEEKNGCAVKVISSGLLRSDVEILRRSKIVWCLRNPHHIALSQTKLESSQIEFAAKTIDGQEYWTSGGTAFKPHRYLNGTRSILVLLDKHPELKSNIITIDYEEMHSNPRRAIQQIAKHFGISPTSEQIEYAVSGIDPLKRRSSKEVAITEDFEAWQTAETLYELTSKGKFDDALVISRHHRLLMKSENNMRPYLDTEAEGAHEATWWMVMNATTLREMAKNGRAIERNMLAMTRVKEQEQFFCKSCSYYNRDGAPYTINRPADVGGELVRNKVNCAKLGKEMTLEGCQRHWEIEERGRQVQTRRGTQIERREQQEKIKSGKS